MAVKYRYFIMKNFNLYLFLMVLTSCSFLTVKNQDKTNQIENSIRKVSSDSSKYEVKFFDTANLENETVGLRSFDLNTQLTDLKSAAEHYINRYDTEVKAKKNDVSSADKKQQFVEGKGLHKPFNSLDLTDKGLYFATKKILSLISEIDSNSENQDIKKYQISQLTNSILQNYTPPAQEEYEILALPITLLKHMSYPTVQSDNSIKTLTADVDIVNEFVSEKPAEGSDNFFSLKQIGFDADNCTYLKSKKGYGVHSGFQIECAGKKFKVKFGGEVYSGPFNSRVYSALGYKVPTINYSEALRVKYDRRIITEFNQRASMTIKVNLANQKVTDFNGRFNRDPFADIAQFVMKDKSEIASAEAKQKLLKKYDKNTVPIEEDFNGDFESQIDSVILSPSTMTLKEDSGALVEVGPWRADDLNYANLKEVRGLMVLSAWVGNFDVRKDNLALYLENPKSKNAAIKVGFADAGSGLGKATYGFSKITSSEVNNMVWQVSETYRNSSGESSDPDRIQLIGLMNIEVNRAFQNINMSDAQWMLQKICQISKDNIYQGLVASGMSSAEVVLAAEKLIYRRNKMLEDFIMPKEVFKGCYVPANKKISYDPDHDGLVQIKNSAGESVKAPSRGYKIQKGILKN